MGEGRAREKRNIEEAQVHTLAAMKTAGEQ